MTIRRKAIFICSPQLGISPESGLGGEVYDREMIKALDRLGVVMLIILPFGKKCPILKHAKIYYLPTPFVYPPWLFNILILPYLFILYHKYRFEILRAHSPYFVGPAALFFKLFHPKIYVDGSYLHLEPKNWFYDFVDKRIIHHFSQVTTISESTKQNIVSEYKLASEKISVIPCGVDPKYRPGRKNNQLITKYHLENKKALLYLGQLIPRKNIAFLFKVLKNLPEEYMLIICGDGPMRVQLEKTAPSGVIFTGLIPEDNKVDYYNLADVFVYPSTREGFGLSILEAAACGLFIVANKLPVFAELKLKNIRLLDLEAQIWAEAITRRITNRREVLRIYTWENAATKYLKTLKKP